MLIMVPILMTIYIRIFRVGRVFELYERYLQDFQKNNPIDLNRSDRTKSDTNKSVIVENEAGIRPSVSS